MPDQDDSSSDDDISFDDDSSDDELTSMEGDSSSDYSEMSDCERSDDEDEEGKFIRPWRRPDICASRDDDIVDDLIYKMEKINGRRGQLHRAYLRESGDWVSIEDWATWIAEDSDRSEQVRSATVDAIKVSFWRRMRSGLFL